jgi:transcription antitermination factor NusG
MKRWFALYVQSRKEKVVERELLKDGYEVYLPIKKELRQWKDRKKVVEMPLISSYIFTYIEENDMWDIVRKSGCIKFIWFNGKPCPIPDNQIESIKLLLAKDIDIEFDNQIQLTKGNKVRIVEGAFAGLVGIIKHKEGKSNFAVRIDALAIDLTITLDKSNLHLVEAISEEN